VGKILKESSDLTDSWNAFWERLIIDGVAVLVGSFLLQGVWFFLVDLLVRWNPGFEPALLQTSSRIGWAWLICTAGMLFWVGVRARSEMQEFPTRR
jgi:hypothetical protein